VTLQAGGVSSFRFWSLLVDLTIYMYRFRCLYIIYHTYTDGTSVGSKSFFRLFDTSVKYPTMSISHVILHSQKTSMALNYPFSFLTTWLYIVPVRKLLWTPTTATTGVRDEIYTSYIGKSTVMIYLSAYSK